MWLVTLNKTDSLYQDLILISTFLSLSSSFVQRAHQNRKPLGEMVVRPAYTVAGRRPTADVLDSRANGAEHMANGRPRNDDSQRHNSTAQSETL